MAFFNLLTGQHNDFVDVNRELVHTERGANEALRGCGILQEKLRLRDVGSTTELTDQFDQLMKMLNRGTNTTEFQLHSANHTEEGVIDREFDNIQKAINRAAEVCGAVGGIRTFLEATNNIGEDGELDNPGLTGRQFAVTGANLTSREKVISILAKAEVLEVIDPVGESVFLNWWGPFSSQAESATFFPIGKPGDDPILRVGPLSSGESGEQELIGDIRFTNQSTSLTDPFDDPGILTRMRWSLTYTIQSGV